MVEVNELRTGNLVKCKISNDAGIYTVQALDAINLKVYLSLPRNVWHTEDKIKGIKITEEWLIKFGFELTDDEGDTKYYQKDNYGINIQENYNIYFYKGINLIEYLLELNYIHQLQNVYFALTQTELKLNE